MIDNNIKVIEFLTTDLYNYIFIIKPLKYDN